MSRLRALALAALALSAALLVGDAARHAAALARAPEAPPPDDAFRTLDEQGHDVRHVRAHLGVLDERAGEGRGLVVQGGSRGYDTGELATLARFVESGGRLLVLGEPDASRLLGVSAAVAPVVDPAASGVRMRGLEAAATLARAWPLQDVRGDARALAWSAPESFVDVDGDGRAQAGDVPGPFALALAAHDGVVVGALALPTGADGEALARELLAEAFPPGTEILVDGTRAAEGVEVVPRAIAATFLDLAHLPALGLLHVALVGSAGVSLAWRARTATRTRDEESLDAHVRPGGAL